MQKNEPVHRYRNTTTRICSTSRNFARFLMISPPIFLAILAWKRLVNYGTRPPCVCVFVCPSPFAVSLAAPVRRKPRCACRRWSGKLKASPCATCKVGKPTVRRLTLHRFLQGLSRVMTRPRGHDPARGSYHEAFKTSWIRAGLGQGASEISRIGSGRAGRFSNLTGAGRVTLTGSDPRELIRPVQDPCFFYRIFMQHCLRVCQIPVHQHVCKAGTVRRHAPAGDFPQATYHNAGVSMLEGIGTGVIPFAAHAGRKNKALVSALLSWHEHAAHDSAGYVRVLPLLALDFDSKNRRQLTYQ